MSMKKDVKRDLKKKELKFKKRQEKVKKEKIKKKFSPSLKLKQGAYSIGRLRMALIAGVVIGTVVLLNAF